MRLIIPVAALLAVSTVYAATIDLDATNRGGLDVNGDHATGGSSTATGNYIVGTFSGDSGSAVRNFFVFDLSGVGGPITGATLQLTLPALTGYLSADPSETYVLYDFLLSPAVLSQFPPGAAAYTDLGSGTSFGSVVLSSGDMGTVVNVVLNASGIAAINASLGSSFALGGASTSLSAGAGVDEYLFGNTIGSSNITRLSLSTDAETVPEPSSALLLIGGLGLLGLSRVRRR